jgi:Tfp pilus assembly protein PilV
VRALSVKGRFLREERGFTIVEMSITIVIMMVMLMALYSVFDMSVKAFSYGNNKVEAVESARVGMEKMEREIRQAYGNPAIFQTWTATQIRFGNDLDGNGAIACPNDDGVCELITYRLDAASNELRRVNSADAGAPGAPVVENVAPGGLAFTYFENDGAPADSEGDITKVQVSLDIAVDPGTDNQATQALTTEIDPRNR